MRIVDTDNFGGDYPDENFVAGTNTTPLSAVEAEKIANEHNEKCGEYSARHWKIVPDDYKLQSGFKP